MNVIVNVIASFLQIVGIVLFKLYGWVVIIGILAYSIWQNNRKKNWVITKRHTLLMIEVPKDNDKKELSAEQMFASLHGILRPRAELIKEGSIQEHISFEIASVGNQIRFYAWTPTHLKDFVEGQIYAQYPTVHITEVDKDYADHPLGDRVVYGTELSLTKTEVLPIKTFATFEVDPLAGITAVLSKLEEVGEEMWIQILVRPIDDSWQNKGQSFIERIQSGGEGNIFKALRYELVHLPTFLLGNLIKGIWMPPETKEKADKSPSAAETALAKAVEEKITKLGYQVKIRIAYIGPDQALAKQRIQAIVGGFKQFNTTNLNGFAVGRYHHDSEFIREYKARLFMDHGHILNITELASVYHLPHTNVSTPSIVWTDTKTAEPPSNLPSESMVERKEDISLFGITNFRGSGIKFGIKRSDRGRHLYIIGQTGTGKSFLLQLLTLSDIYHDLGFAIIDPHGDYATDIMRYIPEERVKDVIYFNPADREFPMAFNPLEMIDPDSKNHITSEIVGVLKRMFEATSWGPRLEHILRFTILALLDTPDSTMLGITRMLTDKEYRKKVVGNVKDPIVKAFWVNEFASWNDKFANEAVAPVLNKVGAFIANPLVRNIIGQPRSTFDLRKIMDEGKILIVNLSVGLVGEDNAAILGALMVTKIQLAAMSRANIPLEQRVPFYLYVDEFQNFATDSFAVILSEARKYALNLTVANQYISQMPDPVKDAVFGNVGSIVTFRVGADDAAYLVKYFDPIVEASDLIKLHNQNIYTALSIDGQRGAPFSARTLRMPDSEFDYSDEIIKHSRKNFAKTKEEVEEQIKAWSGHINDQGQNSDNAQKPNILDNLKNQNQKNFPRHNYHKSNRNYYGQKHTNTEHHQPAQKSANNSNNIKEIKPGETVKL